MRRRNFDDEIKSSLNAPEQKNKPITIRHTSDAAAAFAQLLHRQRDKSAPQIIDVGPGRSIFSALGISRAASSNSHMFQPRDAQFVGDDEEERSNRIGWRTFFAAVFLLLVGVILLVLGLRIYLKSSSDSVNNGLEMIVLGCLSKLITLFAFRNSFFWFIFVSLFLFYVVFLPGIYAGTVIVGAHFGWVGYSYENIPSYDPDSEVEDDRTTIVNHENS